MKNPSELTNNDIGTKLYHKKHNSKDEVIFIGKYINIYNILTIYNCNKSISKVYTKVCTKETLDKFFTLKKPKKPKEKPIVDWSVIPPWFKCVAMDLDGVWFMYTFEPTRGAVSFKPNGSNYIVIPREYAPKFNGDWKDSLVERPK